MILTSIPASNLIPKDFIEFNTTSAARGVTQVPRRVALIGARLTAGTKAVGDKYQVLAEDEADTYFGKGSELALMCRAAFKAGHKVGSIPEIYGVPVADPGGGVKATYTLTVTGPATASGEVVLRIAGRTIRVPVTSGDSANTVAAAIKAALDPVLTELPFVGTVATNVVTLTWNQAGVNGNGLRYDTPLVPAGVGVAVAAGTAGSGAYDITASLDLLVDKHNNALAIANHASGDVTDFLAHAVERSNPGTKKWVVGFFAETGSLATGTTLATGANSEYVVVATAEAFPRTTGEIAAHVAVTRMAVEDPSLTMSGRELDMEGPYGATTVTRETNQQSAMAAGATPLTVDDDGKVRIVRLVTTRTTLDSLPFTVLRDFSKIFTVINVGVQLAIQCNLFRQSDDENKKNDADTRKRLRSMALALLRQLAAPPFRWLQNVEEHKDEVAVEQDAQVKERAVLDVPAAVVPGLEQTATVLRLLI